MICVFFFVQLRFHFHSMKVRVCDVCSTTQSYNVVGLFCFKLPFGRCLVWPVCTLRPAWMLSKKTVGFFFVCQLNSKQASHWSRFPLPLPITVQKSKRYYGQYIDKCKHTRSCLIHLESIQYNTINSKRKRHVMGFHIFVDCMEYIQSNVPWNLGISICRLDTRRFGCRAHQAWLFGAMENISSFPNHSATNHENRHWIPIRFSIKIILGIDAIDVAMDIGFQDSSFFTQWNRVDICARARYSKQVKVIAKRIGYDEKKKKKKKKMTSSWCLPIPSFIFGLAAVFNATIICCGLCFQFTFSLHRINFVSFSPSLNISQTCTRQTYPLKYTLRFSNQSTMYSIVQFVQDWNFSDANNIHGSMSFFFLNSIFVVCTQRFDHWIMCIFVRLFMCA